MIYLVVFIFLRRHFKFLKDEVWSKVLLFSMVLFLARLADAIISFWAPVQIQNVLNNSVVMGFIISFQSLVGLLADLVFPKILKNVRVKKLIYFGLAMSALTSFFLVSSYYWPFVSIFLVTMALWGIYYEFIAFANYQFMGSVVPLNMRAGAWGVTGIFVNLAYFLGPLLASILLLRGQWVTEGVILAFLMMSFVLLTFSKNTHDIPVTIDLTEINPVIELKHWISLARHIWPAIVISMLLGFIDSTFWTTGTIWTEKLSAQSAWGGLFLPLYQLPPIFLGLLVARWAISKGKKILSEKMLIVAGIFLAGLALSNKIPWQLTMVFFASCALSVCYPLIEGVYTDIVARMGKEKKEMIGLTNSALNLSYIVWPPIAGAITLAVGERLTFSIVGVLTVVTAFILLFVTPKKLRLPQEEIKAWD